MFAAGLDITMATMYLLLMLSTVVYNEDISSNKRHYLTPNSIWEKLEPSLTHLSRKSTDLKVTSTEKNSAINWLTYLSTQVH